MPVKISRLRPLRYYRNNEIFIHDIDDNKRFGSLITFLSMSLDDTVSLMNSSVLYTRYINCYFERRFINLQLDGMQRRDKLVIQDEYKEIKAKIPSIKKTFMNVQQYQNYNLLFDLRHQNEIYFTNVRYNPRKKAESYCQYLSSLLEEKDLAGYKKRTIVIPLSSNYLTSGKVDNPLSCIFSLVFFNEGLFKQLFPSSKYEFIAVNTKQNILFKFNSDKLSKKNLPRFQSLINISHKLDIKASLTDEENALLNEPSDLQGVKEIKPISTLVVDKVVSTLTTDPNPKDYMASLTGVELDIANKMEDVAEKVAEKKNIDNPTDLLAELNKNEEFLKYTNELKNEKLTADRLRANTKRNDLLKQEQLTHKINNTGKTLKEILDDYNSKSMDREVYNIDTFNTGLKSSTLKDFEVSYNKKQKEKDTIAILNSFSNEDKEIPVYIRKIEKKNTSDAFNKKETWTITMEDDRRMRHTITIDIPLFIDDHFLYLSESKKSIMHQLMLLPIVKTNFDTVQCTTNYNKAFLFRYGAKISPKLERLKKLMSVTKNSKINYLNGDNRLINTAYLTNMDYDELANTFMYIKFNNMEFHFNQVDLREMLNEKGIKIDKLKEHELPIGLDNGKLIILDVNKNCIQGTQKDLPDYICDKLVDMDSSLLEELNKVTVPKKFVYSRVSILSKRFPLIILLSFKDGLSTVIRKAKIKHEFSDKRKRLSLEEKNTIGEIRFVDGYLYYDLYPFRNSLLLNGLAELPTENYRFEDFNNKETYLDIFELLFKTRNIGKGFSNFIELFLDPITVEVAESVNLPTTFTEFFLHANALLEDNSYVPENNMNLYRIRSNEIVNGLLYKVLSNAYANYKNTANSNNPQKMSVPRDALLKELNACTIINDYSTINPIFEVEAYGGATFKGPSGLNLDSSYTLEKRAFDQSMVGIMGISTPYNNKAGVSRQLSFNPNIINNRGMLKVNNEKSEANIDISNILTPAEILTPWSANHDDSPRTAMLTGQSKHIISVAKTDKLLVGNGGQRALPHMISGEFVHQAKQDGKVVKRDPKTELMIIQYKDGSYDTVDLGPHIAKNGGGGFFISNNKTSDLKEGDKFKAGQIIAKNDQYFKGGLDDTEYAVGNLTKVAIHSGYYTFEDASICTENFCKEMTSYITMKKDVVLGAKTNIDQMAQIGQKVKTGDPLLVFEQAFDEDDANDLLAKLGDELGDEITKMSKNYVKSKYTGVVEDIKIYYTVPESQLSPSLRKVIRDYNNRIKAKQDLIKSFYGEEESNLIIPPCEQVEADNGKVKGVEVGEGVLIEFYVKYEDVLGIGDKITYYTALKSIISEKIPDELSPYGDFRKDENVQCILATKSVNARMTASVFLALYSNKVLIELKRKCKEIYDKK